MASTREELDEIRDDTMEEYDEVHDDTMEEYDEVHDEDIDEIHDEHNCSDDCRLLGEPAANDHDEEKGTLPGSCSRRRYSCSCSCS